MLSDALNRWIEIQAVFGDSIIAANAQLLLAGPSIEGSLHDAIPEQLRDKVFVSNLDPGRYPRSAGWFALVHPAMGTASNGLHVRVFPSQDGKLLYIVLGVGPNADGEVWGQLRGRLRDRPVDDSRWKAIEQTSLLRNHPRTPSLRNFCRRALAVAEFPGAELAKPDTRNLESVFAAGARWLAEMAENEALQVLFRSEAKRGVENVLSYSARQAPQESQKASKPLRFPVWYCTTRANLSPFEDPWYAAGRGASANSKPDDGAQPQYGICLVSVPKGHKFGETKASFLRRLLHGDADSLLVETVCPLAYARFVYHLKFTLHTLDANDRAALVFIHGYNMSFREAAIRVAQIGVDLRFCGVTALFSWPSHEKLLSYIADRDAADAAAQDLASFLEQLQRDVGVSEAHVIAHSMGNRVLISALERLHWQGKPLPLGQIFLAAPDLDSEWFGQWVKRFSKFAKRATIYASSRDGVLRQSAKLSKFDRVGLIPPPTVVSGMDTIDASLVDTSLLGHGYYAAMAPLLHDMYSLLQKDAAPARRQRMHEMKLGDGRSYWRLV